jgi:hypothetical protein
MSKLGKKPIIIPKDTKVKLENGKLILSGPKGSKEFTLNDKIFSATILEDKNLILKLIKKNESSNMLWGTTRSVINSALIGVSVGHEKILELSGVGFRANLKGNVLNLQLGFSTLPFRLARNPTPLNSSIFSCPTDTPIKALLITLRVVPHNIFEDSFFLINFKIKFLSSNIVAEKILSFRVNSFDPLGPDKINFPFSSFTFVSLGMIIGFFPSLDMIIKILYKLFHRQYFLI